MLNKIKTIQQVLASASRAKLPCAQEAMDALRDINGHMIELDGLRKEYIQKALEEQEAEDVANGVVDYG